MPARNRKARRIIRQSNDDVSNINREGIVVSLSSGSRMLGDTIKQCWDLSIFWESS